MKIKNRTYLRSLVAASFLFAVTPTFASIDDVKEDIAGNADNTPATAEQINEIDGVQYAITDVDYSVEFKDGTYEDSENPTTDEIQTVVDAKNETIAIDTDNQDHLDILGVSKEEADALLALYTATGGDS